MESAAGSGLSLIANNLNLAPAVVVDGGTGLVKLKPRVAGTLIDVGGADVATTVLGLTNAELVQITAGTIEIGDNTSGPIGITAALNFNHNLILTSNGAVTDGSVLALTGGSSLTINATNGIDLSASVDVSGGTASFASGPGVAITANNAANSFGTVTIPNGATVTLRDDGGFNLGAVNVSTLLSVESAGTISQSGSSSGLGGLTKLGGGTLVLSAANSYGGTTTISAGILQVGDNGTTGTLGSGPVVDNATLVFVRSDAHTINNAISGNGVVQNSIGTVTLGGNNTYTGSTTITGGTLLVTGQLANTALVTVATPGTLGGTVRLPMAAARAAPTRFLV